MKAELIEQVWQRATSSCEYRLMPQELDELPFQIDHVRARQHRGPTTIASLCLACSACNIRKGRDVAGYDPKSEKLTPLFNPRRHKWARHFYWNGPFLVGRTAIGRVTVEVLAINLPHRVALRQALIQEGVFPPR